MKLNKIAEIRQGYQFRKKVNFVLDGEIKVLQMIDVENNLFSYNSLLRIKYEETLRKHFLQKDDILFCTRGSNNYNILLKDDVLNLIAVSQFLVITPQKNKIVPAFLSWYLKQPKIIAYFNAHRLPSTVPLINKKVLEDLNIELPPLIIQQKIAKTTTLMLEEKRLVKEIYSKKEKMINQILRDSIKENQ